ncbi:CcdB family protein [Aminobacter anthyllidis]|uniref:Toxin CcdB n=1 Tax=Aminobacter anthyllidis TaxID=1035067 RepID=A0A9X1D5Z3_9HYPH|nr:CcdB family protein [Aminobacter anthyllidis]MBT1157697.1 CcdB family protein [Aminobacter anthyllidis]MDH4987586.1 CcdB family protein [Aminobacter anthyllidis]
MARFDLYRGGDADTYLLDVQADLLRHMNTRVVVPVLPPDMAPKPGRRLNPIFSIRGKDYVMVTQFISAVMISELPVAAENLSRHHDQITDALDMLFQGY